MSGSQFQLVALDVDDTLYLERDYIRGGFSAVGEHIRLKHGILDFGERCWLKFEQGVRSNTFDLVADEISLPIDVDELVRIYRTHEPVISMTGDTQLFLQSLSNVNLAIVTDGPCESQRRKLKALRIDEYCPTVVVTSENGPGWEKPSKQSFSWLESSLGVPGNLACYVADNPLKDFDGPLSCGWKVVRMRRPGSLHEVEPTPAGIPEWDTFRSQFELNHLLST
jgi:putative hydrolase of the HAD superfamily